MSAKTLVVTDWGVGDQIYKFPMENVDHVRIVPWFPSCKYEEDPDKFGGTHQYFYGNPAPNSYKQVGYLEICVLNEITKELELHFFNPRIDHITFE